MNYKLHPQFQAALARHEFPLVFNAAATKAACEDDILQDESLMDQLEVMTSPSRFSALSRHRRFCQQVLATANLAINKNQPLELSGQTMATLLAIMIDQNK